MDTANKKGLFETVEKLADYLNEGIDAKNIDPILQALSMELGQIKNQDYDNPDLIAEKVKKVFSEKGTRTNPLIPHRL